MKGFLLLISLMVAASGVAISEPEHQDFCGLSIGGHFINQKQVGDAQLPPLLP